MEEVEDSPDFGSGPVTRSVKYHIYRTLRFESVQSYNSPVEHRFLIGLDQSTNSPLPDCNRKYVSVRTMPPGIQ